MPVLPEAVELAGGDAASLTAFSAKHVLLDATTRFPFLADIIPLPGSVISLGDVFFAIGLVPRALPDMMAYTFYRSECAIRSAAVLGFFGYGTLGAYVKSSFDNLHYGEVWTYLYALFLVIFVVDSLSARLRRRFVGHE